MSILGESDEFSVYVETYGLLLQNERSLYFSRAELIYTMDYKSECKRVCSLREG